MAARKAAAAPEHQLRHVLGLPANSFSLWAPRAEGFAHPLPPRTAFLLTRPPVDGSDVRPAVSASLRDANRGAPRLVIPALPPEMPRLALRDRLRGHDQGHRLVVYPS